MVNCTKEEYIQRFRKFESDISQNKVECDVSQLKQTIVGIPSGIRTRLIVDIDGVSYDFLILFNEKSNKTICLGSGAYDTRDFDFMRENLTVDEQIEHAKLPKYDRWSWDLDMNMIFYNDTTRNFNPQNLLLCGWCVGNDKQWHLDVIRQIICSILEARKLSSSKTVFYGTSAGGFSSLMLSTLVKGSFCIADVPQMDLTVSGGYFNTRIKNCVVDDSNFWNEHQYRLKLSELIKREQYIPKAIVNITYNRVDVIAHYTKFLEQMVHQEDLYNNENLNTIKWNIIPSTKHAPVLMDFLKQELKSIWKTNFIDKNVFY